MYNKNNILRLYWLQNCHVFTMGYIYCTKVLSKIFFSKKLQIISNIRTTYDWVKMNLIYKGTDKEECESIKKIIHINIS